MDPVSTEDPHTGGPPDRVTPDPPAAPAKPVQLNLLGRTRPDQFRMSIGGSIALSLAEGGLEAELAKALKYGSDAIVTIAPAANPAAAVALNAAITRVSMSRTRHSQEGDSDVATVRVAVQSVAQSEDESE